MSEAVGFGATRLIVSLPPADLPVSVEWTINFASQYWPMNISRELCSQEGSGKDMDILRNYVVGYALAAHAPYIWFLSNSILPPNWTVYRLLEIMRNYPNVAICAGMNEFNVPSDTNFEDDPTIVKDEEGKELELLKVAAGQKVGFDCTLIRTELFNKLPEPWFSSTRSLSSEANICQMAMKLGYDVCAYSGVMCGSVDMKTGKSTWPSDAVLVPA